MDFWLGSMTFFTAVFLLMVSASVARLPGVSRPAVALGNSEALKEAAGKKIIFLPGSFSGSFLPGPARVPTIWGEGNHIQIGHQQSKCPPALLSLCPPPQNF